MASTTSAPRAAGRRFLLIVSLAAVSAAKQEVCGAEGNALCKALQAEPAEVQGLGLLQVAKDGAQERRQMQIPNFGDIVNSAQDAVNNAVGSITDQAQDIANNFTQQAQGVAQAMQEEAQDMAANATTSAALIVAQTLNKTLLYVGSEAVALEGACQQAKNEALARIQAANATANEVIAAFEDEATAAVGKVLPIFRNFTAAVSTAGSVASTALAGIGQDELGERIMAQLNKSLSEAEAFTGSLKNVSMMVDGLKTAEMHRVMARLRMVNDTFKDALKEATSYTSAVMDAFDELTDRAASKLSSLPGASRAQISEAFESVDGTARQVVRTAVDGPRELVRGMTSAADAVEATLPEEVRSAAVAVAPASLVALMAAVVAFTG